MSTHLFALAFRVGFRRAACLVVTAALAGVSMLATTASGQVRWAQSYGARSFGANGAPIDSGSQGSGSDTATGIARMPDGGFVVAGQVELPEVYLNVFNAAAGLHRNGALVRYAADGTILWQQLLRQDNDRTTQNGTFEPASSFIYNVLTDAQGNIFVVGGKGNPSNGALIPFVAKFDPNGALIWQRGISGTRIGFTANGNTRPYTAALTRDGGVLVSLEQSTGSGFSDPALAKLNSDGSLAFYAVYDQSAIQYLGTSAVCESATENNVFVAVLNNGFGATLLRIDGSGNLLSQRDTRDGNSGRSESAVAIVATPDGGFATLSRVGLNGSFGVVLRKFNSSLVPIFEKWIQRANPVNTNSNQFIGDDLVAETDGGFLISGNTVANEAGSPPAASGGGTEATIIRVSAAGDLEFVSVLGGPKNEGRTQNSGQPSSFTYVVRAGDGGYGLTTSTFSYRGEVSPEKSDWWTVKTDAARRVRNFSGIMTDLPLSWFTVTNAANTGSANPAFTRVAGDPTTVTTSPQFIFENLANNVGINLPDVIFQGSSPRIVSNLTAEAVVGQHFAYHILAAYFPAGQTLTYSVTGLPAGFRFNTATGVISGAPQPGSETTTPLLLTITATDGVETAQATLRLSIGSGVPLFAVNGSDQPAFPTPAGTPVVGQADKPLVFAAKYPGRRASQVVGVQATTTPNDEASWRRLETGTDGYMTLNVATQRYVLSSTNYPALNGVYFRARVTADGRPEVKSNVVGPFDLGSAAPRLGQTLFHIIRNGRRADLDFRVDMISPRTDMTVRVQSTKRPTEESFLERRGHSECRAHDAGRRSETFLAYHQRPGAGRRALLPRRCHRGRFGLFVVEHHRALRDLCRDAADRHHHLTRAFRLERKQQCRPAHYQHRHERDGAFPDRGDSDQQ